MTSLVASTTRWVATSSSGEQAFAEQVSDGVRLRVWVVPGARRSEVAEVRDGYLRLRLAAPAREGRANDELVRFVAARLGLRRSAVRVVNGHTSRRKALLVEDAQVSAVVKSLCPAA